MSLTSLRTFLRSTSGERASSTESSSIPSSPSFSDFSLGTHGDVVGATSAAAEPPNPFQTFASLHRGSLDTATAGLHVNAGRSTSPGPESGSPTLWSRLSLDGGSPVRRPNLGAASVAFPGASPSFHRHSAAINVPQLRSATLPSSASDAGFAQTAPMSAQPEPEARRRGGRPERIDGMDYYSWCELLRSSSL